MAEQHHCRRPALDVIFVEAYKNVPAAASTFLLQIKNSRPSHSKVPLTKSSTVCCLRREQPPLL